MIARAGAGELRCSFWYRQKVVDSIREHYNKYRPNPNEFTARTGYDFNDFELLRASRQFFGSWSAAVRSAGINGKANNKPKQPNNGKSPMSKARVLEVIRGMAEAGEDMSSQNFVIMHNEIWQSSCGKNGYFSHWDTALRSAGLNPGDYLGMNTYWTECKILDGILDLYESQLMISGPYIKTHFWHLYRYGQLYFGNWRNAVNSTGLGIDAVMEEYHRTAERQQHFQLNLFSLLQRLGRDISAPDRIEHGFDTGTGPLGVFAVDESRGALLATSLRSWWPGLEGLASSYLASKDFEVLEIYYLRGEPRTWNNHKIQFTHFSDLIQQSLEGGTDEYMRRILGLQYNVPSFL